MEFSVFKNAVSKQMDSMLETKLFTTDTDKDEIWETYLASFPAGTNNMYRERTEHDCNCCRSFIRSGGSIVTIIDGELVSIWDVEIGGYYQDVAAAMSAYVKSKALKDIFLHTEGTLGVDFNFDTETGSKWSHFYYKLPAEYVQPKDADKLKGIARSNKEVLQRGLDELSIDAIDTVLDLIYSNSIYRGEEHKKSVEMFKGRKVEYDKLSANQRDMYAWYTSLIIGGAGKFRNTVIGTLVTDVSDGVDLEKAVASFESKVAPQNYKRTTAVISQKMIENAQQFVANEGIEDSLYRRHSTQDDIPVNEVLFVNRDTLKELGLFDMMKKEVPVETKTFKMQEASIEELVNDILPNANSLEVLFDNSHVNNLMSLVSPKYPDAPSILNWDNNFSWSYNGEVADSMREQVVSLGGRVDGVLRFTHAWNHDGQNQSLMDLHVFMPSSGYSHKSWTSKPNDRYPGGPRVGWNRRSDSVSGGVQDVDHTSRPGTSIPLENITFPSINRMEDGVYNLVCHNWSNRKPSTSGFKAEAEFGGQLYKYNYPNATKHKEWIPVVDVRLKDGVFSVEKHHLKPDSEAQEVWGITTKAFHKVNMLMNSPNHWGDNSTGNKHWFFILEGCATRDSVRGFYNEQLSPEMTEHRKVFEVLGTKTKVEYSKQQMSGLGFSSTVNKTVVCKVDGRLYNVNF